jgi:hypothetical protein
MLTATALVFYGPGVVGIAGSQVLVRAYQALHEIRRLVIIGIAVMALNIALMVALTHIFGFPGLPIAMSVSPTVLCVMMLTGLRHRLPGLDLGVVGTSAWRVLVAGALAAGSARAMTALVPGMELLALVMGGGAGLAVFGLALFWLSREDAQRQTARLWMPSKARLTRLIERAAVRRSEHVVVLSRFSARQVGNIHGATRSRTTVIPGGVDLERFTLVTDRQAAREALGLSVVGRSCSPYAGSSRAWGWRGSCVLWLSFQVWRWWSEGARFCERHSNKRPSGSGWLSAYASSGSFPMNSWRAMWGAPRCREGGGRAD